MAKRQIKVEILPDGTIKFDNAGNPDEKRIMKELQELAQLLSGDPQKLVIEKHVHTHATTHTHTDGTVHTHG